MKRPDRSLSLILLGLILSGLFSSAVHLHTDQYDATNADQQKISQDHNFCPICASQFRYEADENPGNEDLLHESFYHFSVPSFVFSDPLISVPDSRAPPYSG